MKFKYTLFFVYLVIWSVLAYSPWYRDDWWLENILVFISLPIVIWAEKRVHFSPASAWMLFVFFVLHAIGAHYTYSEMPWFSLITESFGFERNHYDRLIHFLFGFLLFRPFYELFHSFGQSKRSALWTTFLFLIASSGVYEMIEWIATQLTHNELGTAFLGIQGDEWDSQKDMACGYFGTLLAIFFWWHRIVKKPT